jgi:aspartate kinase
VAAFERLARIVLAARGDRRVVVVSAVGKTTNRLVDALETAVRGDAEGAAGRLSDLRRDTGRLAADLFGVGAPAVAAKIAPFFDDLDRMAAAVAVLRSVPEASRDHFLAQGELVSSILAAEALAARAVPAVRIDSRGVMLTDDRFGRARPDSEAIAARWAECVRPVLEAGRVPVLPGYVGATPDGRTTTLGRGGSDYSAAVFGAAAGAELVEIWTDVDGMLTADPRIVPQARLLEVVSAEEASELAYFGARVLHPLTLAPAIEKGIPVRIRNSRRPEGRGTEIRSSVPPGAGLARSIAHKRGIATVDIVTGRMLMASGFLRTLFEVFARHDTAVDMISTSEVSVSVTVDDPSRLPEIEKALAAIAQVEIARERAIVCLVGQNLKFTPGVAARVFRAVEDVNVLMISQGASRRNVSFVVEEKDVERAVQRLHAEFFGS